MGQCSGFCDVKGNLKVPKCGSTYHFWNRRRGNLPEVEGNSSCVLHRWEDSVEEFLGEGGR